MLETVAIIGPARFGVPLTQALTAPILGRLHARGVGFWPQLAACALVRLLHNAATTAFFIWVIAGGLDAYAGTYDAIGRRVGFEVGTADALVLTLVSLLGWALSPARCRCSCTGAGCGRGGTRTTAPRGRPIRRWWGIGAANATIPDHRGRFDPRAVALSAAVAFALLLGSTEWAFLAAMARWLAVAWLAAAADPEPLPAGLAFAAILAGGRVHLRPRRRARARRRAAARAPGRAARARATWLRAAARRRRAARGVAARARSAPARPVGDGGLRGARRASPPRAASQTPRARSPRSSGEAPKRPRELLDAVLAWVVRESRAFEPAHPAAAACRSVHAPRDYALIASRAAPVRLALGQLGLGGRARRDQQVVEERRRQARLEQRAVQRLEQQIAAVGVHAATPTARRAGPPWPRASGWPSRTGRPPAPRRSRGPPRTRRRRRGAQLGRA